MTAIWPCFPGSNCSKKPSNHWKQVFWKIFHVNLNILYAFSTIQQCWMHRDQCKKCRIWGLIFYKKHDNFRVKLKNWVLRPDLENLDRIRHCYWFLSNSDQTIESYTCWTFSPADFPRFWRILTPLSLR